MQKRYRGMPSVSQSRNGYGNRFAIYGSAAALIIIYTKYASGALVQTAGVQNEHGYTLCACKVYGVHKRYGGDNARKGNAHGAKSFNAYEGAVACVTLGGEEKYCGAKRKIGGAGGV